MTGKLKKAYRFEVITEVIFELKPCSKVACSGNAKNQSCGDPEGTPSVSYEQVSRAQRTSSRCYLQIRIVRNRLHKLVREGNKAAEDSSGDLRGIHVEVGRVVLNVPDTVLFLFLI